MNCRLCQNQSSQNGDLCKQCERDNDDSLSDAELTEQAVSAAWLMFGI